MVKFTFVLASVVLLAGRILVSKACNDGEIGIGYQDASGYMIYDSSCSQAATCPHYGNDVCGSYCNAKVTCTNGFPTNVLLGDGSSGGPCYPANGEACGGNGLLFCCLA